MSQSTTPLHHNTKAINKSNLLGEREVVERKRKKAQIKANMRELDCFLPMRTCILNWMLFWKRKEDIIMRILLNWKILKKGGILEEKFRGNYGNIKSYKTNNGKKNIRGKRMS